MPVFLKKKKQGKDYLDSEKSLWLELRYRER